MSGAVKTPRGAGPDRRPVPEARRPDLAERRRQALEAGRARFAALDRWRAGSRDPGPALPDPAPGDGRNDGEPQ